MASVTKFPGTAANESTQPVAWVNPANAEATDGAYATNALPGGGTFERYLLATNFGFSIPSDATIDGLEYTVLGHVSAGTVTPFVGATKTGNHTFAGSAVTTPTFSNTSDAAIVYGGSSNLWGTTWAPSDINSSLFGFLFSPSGSVAATVSIDSVSVTVYYTPASTVVTSDVTSAAAVSQTATSDVTSAAAISTPDTKDVTTAAATNAPAHKDVTSAAAVSETATKDVTSTAAISRAPVGNVTSAAAVSRAPGLSVTTAAATSCQVASNVSSGAALSTATTPTLDVTTAAALNAPASASVTSGSAISMTEQASVTSLASIVLGKAVTTAAAISAAATSDVTSAAAIGMWQIGPFYPKLQSASGWVNPSNIEALDGLYASDTFTTTTDALEAFNFVQYVDATFQNIANLTPMLTKGIEIDVVGHSSAADVTPTVWPSQVGTGASGTPITGSAITGLPDQLQIYGGATEAWGFSDNTLAKIVGTFGLGVNFSGAASGSAVVLLDVITVTVYVAPFASVGTSAAIAPKPTLDVTSGGSISRIGTKDVLTSAALTASAKGDVTSAAAIFTGESSDVTTAAAISAPATANVATAAAISRAPSLDVTTAAAVAHFPTSDVTSAAAILVLPILSLVTVAAISLTQNYPGPHGGTATLTRPPRPGTVTLAKGPPAGTASLTRGPAPGAATQSRPPAGTAHPPIRPRGGTAR